MTTGTLDTQAVVIIGMSGRFPGARDLDEFWANLRDGVCSISDFSEAELLADGVDPAELRGPDYVPAKGYLPEADRFEAELFGFNRTEAAALDPQHRLVLEAAWAALEDAGYDPLRPAARTGVYLGGGPSEHAIAAQLDRDLASALGAMTVRILTDREFLAPWVSYRLGLDGPSITVQTACSTSLTAVHLAAQALLLGECDTALAGGVSLDSIGRRGYVYREGGIFSPDGRCRPFDEKAAGTVGGNGVGVVVLRRLEDAVADGDPVRAVVRGSAVTNDGAAKVGFTAPSVDRQAAAMAEAWAAADLDPASAQYVELHGTGTALGDRIEVAAAASVFGARAGMCAIGSVKSNVGHLDAAAGAAALIKTVLMLEHRTLVPTANITRAHPDLGLAAADLRLVDQCVPWESPPDGSARRAGVCAAGIGGTNVHVVLEEAPAASERPVPSAPSLEILPLSARTPAQLAMAARRLAEALRAVDPPALADVGHTLRTVRPRLAARGAVLASTPAEAASALDALAAGNRPAPPADVDVAEGLRALAEAWVRGEEVSWPSPAAGARRIHLPTYPFAGERHGTRSLAALTSLASLTVAGSLARVAGPDEDAETDVAAAVAKLLMSTLGLREPEDLEKSYFAADGDSLTAVHLVGRLGDDFDIDVPVTLFLEDVPLRELVARIAAARPGRAGGDREPDLLESLLDELETQR